MFSKGKDTSKPVLLLLHGTGGNELDLLPLAEIVDGSVGIKRWGNVLEEWDAAFLPPISRGHF